MNTRNVWGIALLAAATISSARGAEVVNLVEWQVDIVGGATAGSYNPSPAGPFGTSHFGSIGNAAGADEAFFGFQKDNPFPNAAHALFLSMNDHNYPANPLWSQVERGYNTHFTNDAAWDDPYKGYVQPATESLTLGALRATSTVWYQSEPMFMLEFDVNEGSGGGGLATERFLSLDAFRVYTRPSIAPESLAHDASPDLLGTLVYAMNTLPPAPTDPTAAFVDVPNRVLLDGDRTPGNNNLGDGIVLLPTSLFMGLADEEYFTLWTHFGGLGVAQSEGGAVQNTQIFEDGGTVDTVDGWRPQGGKEDFGYFTSGIPEPHEYAMAAGLALLGFAAYRRMRG